MLVSTPQRARARACAMLVLWCAAPPNNGRHTARLSESMSWASFLWASSRMALEMVGLRSRHPPQLLQPHSCRQEWNTERALIFQVAAQQLRCADAAVLAGVAPESEHVDAARCARRTICKARPPWFA